MDGAAFLSFSATCAFDSADWKNGSNNITLACFEFRRLGDVYRRPKYYFRVLCATAIRGSRYV